jgi:hypothetical protein
MEVWKVYFDGSVIEPQLVVIKERVSAAEWIIMSTLAFEEKPLVYKL